MNYSYDASIILVNYNGKRYIDTLLSSLVKLEPSNYTFEVVFVDNASSDDSVEYLEKHFSNTNLNIKIVKSKENLGFAGGNNLGVKNADGKYIIFLNNDTAVDKNWFSGLMDPIVNDETIGIVNSKLLFYYDFVRIEFSTIDKIILKKNYKINGKNMKFDSKFCKNLLFKEDELVCFGHSIIYVPLINGIADYQLEFKVKENPLNNSTIQIDFDDYFINNNQCLVNLNKEELKDISVTLIQNAGSGINENYDGFDIGFGEEDSEKYNKSYSLNNACGASIVMLRDDFIKSGMFDEKFFMYYEDTDLSYRIKNLGKKLVYSPTSIVRHIHTGSSEEWSPFFLYHVSRNKLLFVYKNISKHQFKRFYRKNIISSIRHRNIILYTATKDAKKIINGSTGIKYDPKFDRYKKD